MKGNQQMSTRPPESIAGTHGLEALPPQPIFCGIYFLCREGEVVYVGQSIDIHPRVRNHAKGNSCASAKQFDSVFWIAAEEKDLDWLETFWIDKLQPPLNGVPGPLARNGEETRRLRAIEQRNERRVKRMISEEKQGFRPLEFGEPDADGPSNQ